MEIYSFERYYGGWCVVVEGDVDGWEGIAYQHDPRNSSISVIGDKPEQVRLEVLDLIDEINEEEEEND